MQTDTLTLYRKYSLEVRILKLVQVLTLGCMGRGWAQPEGLMVHAVPKSLGVVCQGLLITLFKNY